MAGGCQRSPVSQSTCRKDRPRGPGSMTPKVIGSVNRRGPIEPGLNTAVEPSRVNSGTYECPQTKTSAW